MTANFHGCIGDRNDWPIAQNSVSYCLPATIFGGNVASWSLWRVHWSYLRKTTYGKKCLHERRGHNEDVRIALWEIILPSACPFQHEMLMAVAKDAHHWHFVCVCERPCASLSSTLTTAVVELELSFFLHTLLETKWRHYPPKNALSSFLKRTGGSMPRHSGCLSRNRGNGATPNFHALARVRTPFAPYVMTVIVSASTLCEARDAFYRIR